MVNREERDRKRWITCGVGFIGLAIVIPLGAAMAREIKDGTQQNKVNLGSVDMVFEQPSSTVIWDAMEVCTEYGGRFIYSGDTQVGTCRDISRPGLVQAWAKKESENGQSGAGVVG